jgi:hypothetical protein
MFHIFFSIVSNDSIFCFCTIVLSFISLYSKIIFLEKYLAFHLFSVI